MNTGDLTPDSAGLLSLFISLTGAIDKGDTLADVETSLLLVSDILQLDKRGRGLLSTLTALVTQVASLYVETIGRLAVIMDILMDGWGAYRILFSATIIINTRTLESYPGQGYGHYGNHIPYRVTVISEQ